MTTQQRDGQEALREATEVAGDRDRARVGYQRQCAAAMTMVDLITARFIDVMPPALRAGVEAPGGREMMRYLAHYAMTVGERTALIDPDLTRRILLLQADNTSDRADLAERADHAHFIATGEVVTRPPADDDRSDDYDRPSGVLA